MNEAKRKNINQMISKFSANSESAKADREYKQIWISQHERYTIVTDTEVTWNEHGLRWLDGRFGIVFADGHYDITSPYSCNVTELIDA